MQLRLIPLALACCVAEPLTATFRSVPIALPPIGEPIQLLRKGTYDTKLVHIWPPVQFDRWTPVEYYEPYGYVYLNEDDGREYIFDTHATRPVVRSEYVLAEAEEVVETAVDEGSNSSLYEYYNSIRPINSIGPFEPVVQEPVVRTVEPRTEIVRDRRTEIVRDRIPRDTVVRDTVVRDTLPRTEVVRDTVVRDTVPRAVRETRTEVVRDARPRTEVVREVGRDTIVRDTLPRTEAVRETRTEVVREAVDDDLPRSSEVVEDLVDNDITNEALPRTEVVRTVRGRTEYIDDPDAPVVEYVRPYGYKPSKLRGWANKMDAFVNVPANLMKDAIFQSKVLVKGKYYGQDCLLTGGCEEIPDTWVAYINACQEKANLLASSLYEILAPLKEKGELGFYDDFYDDELWADIGTTLIEKVEAGRKMLIAETEALPNIVDKQQLVRLLIEPLEYFEHELLMKSSPLAPKGELKEDFIAKNVHKINAHSAKIETLIANTVNELIRFPKHIVHKVRTPLVVETTTLQGQEEVEEEEATANFLRALPSLNILPTITGVVPSFFKPVLETFF